MKKEQKPTVTAIIFYVFAVLFLAYTAFMIFTAYEYVSGYIEQGTISYGSDFKDILSLYVQQAGPYLVYALLLYGMGYLVDVAAKVKESKESDHAGKETTVSAAAVKETKIAVKKEQKTEAKKQAEKKEKQTKDTVKDTKKENKGKSAKAKESKKEETASAEPTAKESAQKAETK